jgi:hypothetical protein
MKNFITTTMALLALTVAANATDLPSKKTAPTPPVAAAAPAAHTSTDSLTVTYGQDLSNNFGAKVDDAYGVSYKHSLGGGFSVGGAASTTQVSGSQLNQNLEAQAGYALPAFSGVTLSGKVGVGEKFSTTNFPYVAVYGNADYKVMDGLTLNAVQYRYRSAIDTGTYGYQSHRLGTGVTYDINSTYSVSATVYRSFDTSSSFNATGDAFALGLTAKF